MSIVRIFFNPLNAKDRQEYPIEIGTQIIDFLQEHYPAGFSGLLRVFVGNQEIQIEDLDYVVKEDEQITMLIMPADGGLITGYIISALIAVAVGFVINLLFPPSVPSAFNPEGESPVYSLNPTRNTARLGEPIPVIYGTVSWPLDFASAPSSFYFEGSNDQYVDELLCLGHGEFFRDSLEVYIGDTPVSIMEPGTVRYWIFDQLQHQNTMGRISDIINADLAGTDVPWVWRENVFTSPEVESWEFSDQPSEEDPTSRAISGIAKAAAYDPVLRTDVYGNISGVNAALNLRGGDTIAISGTANNNGSFLIGSVVEDPDDANIVTLFEAQGSPTKFADEDPMSGTFTTNVGANTLTAGPFRAQKEGQLITRVECDIVFPQGLYRVDGTSGKIKDTTVSLQFTYQQIDDNGDPVTAAIIETKDYTAKQRSPYRATKRSGALPVGMYEVSIERTDAVKDDSRIHDITTWVGLKGVIINLERPVYAGNTTLMAIRMKATNGLGSAARQRIRVTAKRRFYDNERSIDFDSSNPIVAIQDIWNNPDYGLNRPLDELDTVKMDELFFKWGNGPKLNGSFDTRGTGFDAMQNVASLCGARIVQDGGLTTIVPDAAQPVRAALFSSANIVKDSLKIEYSFETSNEYDGVNIEYRDAKTFQVKYITRPLSAKTPETFVLFGCTDDTYAGQYATYLNNVRRLRRKLVTFQTELEGLIPSFGQRIGVSSPFASWGQSGVIVEIIDPFTFRVDQNLEWTDDNVILLRSETGTSSSQYAVTKGATNDIVVFGEVPDVDVYLADTQEPTNYIFGVDKKLVKDFIISKISPKGERIVEIQAQTYTANIYTGGPPQMQPTIE